MLAVKRKHPAVSAKVDTAKKRRKTSNDPAKESHNDSHQTSPKLAPRKSILSKEQTAFPRGGAGPLSLLEKKQIRRDVALEVQNPELFSTKPDGDARSDASDLDLGEIDKTQTFAKRKSKKSQKSTKKQDDADSVHIESVSYKRLSEESLLLGRVSHISSQDLTISLPNNLVGFVPLTAISKQFTAKLEKVIQDDAQSNDSNHEEEEQIDTDMHSHFKIGQTLRVAVRGKEDEDDDNKSGRKRIDLAIEPSVVNRSLTKAMLTSGIAVQAAVVSIEDHGAIVDLGLQDGIAAFIAKDALPDNMVLSEIKEGSVLLCTVKSASSKGKAIQLSLDLSPTMVAKTASSVNALLPGNLVEVLLTQVSEEGLAGKVLGLLDVTADQLHSTAFEDKDAFVRKYQVGQKVKGRLIANFPRSEDKKLAFSINDSLVNLDSHVEERLALSSIVDRTQVLSVAHGLGLYFSLPSGALGFAHISKLSDNRIDMLSEISGPYRKGTEHQARVIDYNAVDGLYILSLEKSVLEQPFLRLADVEAGAVVKGTVEKLLVSESGVRGILVKISPGITGLVSTLHLSDAALAHPEKKFREGMAVKSRVLSVDVDKRRLDLTLKKTLTNSDQPVWSAYDELQVGQTTVGTLIKVDARGAIVQFYGSVKGRLPVSEMSEAYIKDATEHFKVGQVLTVHILKVDGLAKKLILSARDPTGTAQNDTTALLAGDLVSGVVFEKTSDDLTLRLEPSGSIARLTLDHVADGSAKKRKSAHEKIRVGQKMDDVLILEIKGRQVILSNKASLRKAAEEGKFLKTFTALKEDAIVTGYISNITDSRIFVRFAQGITGVINKASIPEDKAELPNFGMSVLQAISARVVQIDYKGATPRFWLSMITSNAKKSAVETTAATSVEEKELIEPVDEQVKSYSDFAQGAVVKARITSVKETQINVELAKGIQGRVDVSEVFDSIDDIHDHKRPLKQFSSRQVINVKILGQHDSRSYKFLPLSHRGSKNVVFELSARPSAVSNKDSAVLKLEDIKIGDSHLVFVNNVGDHSLMVNVSPAVRGGIRASDVSDDLSLAANLARNFPVGSVLEARVTAVDLEKNRLDLSAKSGDAMASVTLDSISAGDIVAGRITKITDRSILVQLSDTLIGAVDLIDMADDFDLADTSRFQKNEVVRAYVLQVDKPNKKVYLSLRPSKILSSGLDIKDPESMLEQLKVGDVRRGFVSNVTDKGIFVSLSRGVTAFVRVTNLSDEYLKEWKDQFQKDQLVQGKIISVDNTSGHIQMSLKKSHVTGVYTAPVTFNDLKAGDVVEGRVAKIESFGVFIVVANSDNVRGLCHRSEIAEKRVEDVTKLGFSEGDVVKIKVLKVEPDKRRINFGMKASYFGEAVGEEESEDEDMIDVENKINEDTDEDDEGVELEISALTAGTHDSEDEESDGVPIGSEHDNTGVIETPAASKGLSVGGFDWYGLPSMHNTATKRPAEALENETSAVQSKKRKKKPEVLVDRTGDLDRDGPQSVDDFERLLLSEPDNAQLWIQFMAFHIDLGDTDMARDVGEKALKSIGLAQQTEKQAVWIALLNLENVFGDDESIEATLQRACQTMDPEDMYSKLASIYIQSGKHGKADNVFQTMTKKFTQNPKLWINYATFLFDTMEDPARARALLPRALQALPPFAHFDITRTFAQLEFKTKTGVPEEGRTRFQGLVNLYPKRLDLFNVMLDLEIKLGDVEQIRGVFEQALSKKLKPAKAKPFFSRWLKFEKENGDQQKVEEVEARAAKWVQQYQKPSE